MVRWLGRLFLEKPMAFALAARCLELVARAARAEAEPGRGWARSARPLANASLQNHAVPGESCANPADPERREDRAVSSVRLTPLVLWRLRVKADAEPTSPLGSNQILVRDLDRFDVAQAAAQGGF